MTLDQVVRAAIDRRVSAVERSLAAVEGLFVEREEDNIHVRGRRLLGRSIEDMRLRFAGFAR
jgi:hypothetical protein